MKSFFTWLFTTGLGIGFFIGWLIFITIFIWQGFKTVASLIVDGEMLTANAFFIACIICVSVFALMTAQNYRINWVNPRKK
jgi:hypothetical protein